jgi:hypothetical protein
MSRKGKILSCITIIVLIATMLIGSTNVVQAAPSSDIALAQQAGQSFIAQRTQIFPDWASASLSNPQTYYNLQGQINAYLFTIQNNNQTIGRIVVGSTLLTSAINSLQYEAKVWYN